MQNEKEMQMSVENSIRVISANRYEIEDKYGSNAALDIFLAI